MSNGERSEQRVKRDARTISDFFAREGIGLEDSRGKVLEGEKVTALLERAVRKVMQDNYEGVVE